MTVVEPKVNAVSWPGGGFILPFFRMTFREFTVTAEAPGYSPFSQTIDFRDATAFPLRLAIEPEGRDEAFTWITSANAEEALAGPGWDAHSRRVVREALRSRPSIAVVVPRFAVAGPFGPAGAWLEVDMATGEVGVRLADGVYGATTSSGLVREPATGALPLTREVLGFFAGRVPAWQLVRGGPAPGRPLVPYLEMHRAAVGDFSSVVQMMDDGVFRVSGNPALADPLLLHGIHAGAGRARAIRKAARGD